MKPKGMEETIRGMQVRCGCPACQESLELAKGSAKVKEDLEENEVRFTYHPPKTSREITFYQDFRAQVKELADDLVMTLPRSRERARALTALEDAVVNANAAVARRGGLGTPGEG